MGIQWPGRVKSSQVLVYKTTIPMILFYKMHQTFTVKKNFQLIILSLFISFSGFFIACTPNNSYESYETLKSFQIPSPKSEVVELRHKKSGARLVLVKNSDVARVFKAIFKTPPYDDTGLFHIFEHAVLAGSRLYPSKSGFSLVSKSSLAMLNALTGKVYTKYPFTTRDHKDFDNLLSFYMDSVFFPKVVKDPRIIKREGWRYEVDPKTKKMSINGIVFSEMKGAYSSPKRNLFFHLFRSVLPQTPYSYENGGLPEKIATLRFDQIVKAHKKYYHPQNSIIYLYGDIDYKKTLTTIDKGFLSHFEKIPEFTSPKITLQKDFDYPSEVVEATYPGPKVPNKDFVVKTYVLGPLTPVQRKVARILIRTFIKKPTSPLKLRIFKEGLSQSVDYVDLESRDNAFGFVFTGTEASHREKIKKILDDELDKIIKKGLDHGLLISVLNKDEFSYREKYSNNSYKGVSLERLVAENWLYPDQPLEEALNFLNEFRELRKLLTDKNFVRNFFKKHFKENPHSRWLVMKPDPLLSEKFNTNLEKRVEEALKTKPLAEYEKEDRGFRQWVALEEPSEVTSKIPMLKLSDIKGDDSPIPFNKFRMDSTEIIEYPQETSGISYVKLFFDLKGLKEEELKNLMFFTRLLKKTNTTNHSFKALSKRIDTYTGNFSFMFTTYTSVKNPEDFHPTLFVNLEFLNENSNESFSLLKELLRESQFSPLDRVDSLIREIKIEKVNTVSNRALDFANIAAKKNFLPISGGFEDETRGGSFQEYILKSKIDPKHLSSDLKKILKNVFNQSRLYLVTVAADQSEFKKIRVEMKKIKNSLPPGNSENQIWSFSDQKHYEGYTIPGEVQYVVQTTSFKNGLKFNGALKVYSQYLDTYFMWPRLREQAGAYGAWTSFSRNGLFTLSTFKDPHLKQSFDTFSQVVDFMKNEKPDEKKLRSAILGSSKMYYMDKSVASKTDFMTMLYLTDQSWDDYMKKKKEILSTTYKDFEKISGVLAKAFKNSKKTVAGNPEKLKQEASFLKQVLSLQ